MPHVDDGRLHAFLDGALAEGTAARRAVEDHLRRCADCRERLELARADRGAAGEILALLTPDEVVKPPFEELAARGAGGGAEDAVGGGGTPGAPRRRSSVPLRVSMAWAATVVLALGGGWLARGIVGTAPVEDASPPAMPTAGEARSGVEPEPGAVAATPEAPEAREETDTSAAEPPPAAPPVAGDAVAARAAPAEEFEEAAPTDRVEAREAPVVPSEEAATAVAALAARADVQGSWRAVTPAEAGRALGRAPLDLDGLPWERMELARVGTQVLVRTVHPLEGEERVELVQAAERREDGAADTPMSRAREMRSPDLPDSLARRAVQERVTIGPTTFSDALRATEPAAPSAGGEHGEVRLLVRGLSDETALGALLQRIR